MHICVVGSGTSGWLAVNQLKELPFIKKVTIIGSPKIPHIGVGESTTLTLPAIHKKFNVELAEFIRESHAAVKYGVYYKGWSNRDWIHFFKSGTLLKKNGISTKEYITLLGNKPAETFIHDICGSMIWKEVVGKNNVFPKNSNIELENEYPNSYHFDAGCYITFLKNQAVKSPKVQFISDTVQSANFEDGEYIKSIILESGKIIKANYFVNTTGQNLKTKNVFNEQYDSLEDVLLTTKAVVYPLEYTDKREQFHPYTVAKTMKYGWRWITPTWERIGTGYTFSENHISIDEAINEFITDIGDKSIIPNVVDFKPRVNKQTFKINSCSIGMANGFLEPLDAPGLSITNVVTYMLEEILKHYYLNFKDKSIKNNIQYLNDVVSINNDIKKVYNFWATFILNQYKTCNRLDSSFWVDQKQVKWDDWTLAVKDLISYYQIHKNPNDIMMLAQTIASKDIQYYTGTSKDIKPFKLIESTPVTQHHLDYIQNFHK